MESQDFQFMECAPAFAFEIQLLPYLMAYKSLIFPKNNGPKNNIWKYIG